MEPLWIICVGLGLLLTSHVIAVWRWSRTLSRSHEFKVDRAAVFAPDDEDAGLQDSGVCEVVAAGQRLLGALEAQERAAAFSAKDGVVSLAEAREMVAAATAEYATAMRHLRSTTHVIEFAPGRGHGHEVVSVLR